MNLFPPQTVEKCIQSIWEIRDLDLDSPFINITEATKPKKCQMGTLAQSNMSAKSLFFFLEIDGKLRIVFETLIAVKKTNNLQCFTWALCNLSL